MPDIRPGARSGELRANWPIIVAAAMGVLVGLTGIPNYTFGIFLKPLGDAFGWSRSQVAFGVLFLHSGTFLTSPFIGRFIDRHGARRVALISLFGLAIGLAALSAIGPSLKVYYAAWALVALLGCGTTPLTWTRMITRRFDRARGLALSLALTGTGLASVLGPKLCGMLIASVGWRGAYLALAGFVLMVALPVVALFSTSEAQPVARSEGPEMTGLTLSQAARTRHFWQIAIGMFCVILAQAAAMVHLVPLLTDRGIAPGDAANLAGLMGVMVIVGRIGSGALVDRLHAPHVAGIALLFPAIALLLLSGSTTIETAIAATLLLGLAAGAEVDLLAYLTSRYFGLKHYGLIYGVNLSVFALGAGIGPGLAGMSFDRTGSYQFALFVGAALLLAGALLMGTLGRYPSAGIAKRPEGDFAAPLAAGSA